MPRHLRALPIALLLFAPPASAEPEFDVTVAAGSVVVKAKGTWHINKDYPWKLVVGDVKLDKSRFKLDDATASVAAPSGAGKLKGGVCNADQCLMISKEISIP